MNGVGMCWGAGVVFCIGMVLSLYWLEVTGDSSFALGTDFFVDGVRCAFWADSVVRAGFVWR
jgi:hypothetical protein